MSPFYKPRGWALGLLLLTGCGARSELRGGEPLCEVDMDCDQTVPCFPQICRKGACLAEPLDCPSTSVCAPEACNPATGQCEAYSPTQDLDGDGFNGPRPGYAPGDDDACGDDCDDTSPLARPGAQEVCDGVDNDCDGVADNDALFLALDTVPELRRLQPSADGSSRKGLAYGAGIFAAGYRSNSGGARSSWINGIDENSWEPLWSEEAVVVNTESFGVDLAWSGDAFGATWQDLRFSDYEVFFNRFDIAGRKLGPDLRITDAVDFSTQSIVRFDQGRYIVVWTDRRRSSEGRGPGVYVQLVDAQGALLGENQLISADDEDAESPDLAATPARYGVVYTDSPRRLEEDEGDIRLVFASFDKDFNGRSAVRLADDHVAEPRVVAAGNRFVVTWSEMEVTSPGPSVMGAVLSDTAEIIVPPQPITQGAMYAMESALLSFGDRIMLFWTDNYDGNYELYAQVMDLEFNVLEERTRLTDDPSDTRGPIAARGATGAISFLVDDWRDGVQQAYYSAIECKMRILR
ncbi:MAG TPA: putative metal-binding motif-containing protein [Polyangiaceae bacterium]|nr:putative metal-binding motif-containing protein [Polyangiaceae bacterium]